MVKYIKSCVNLLEGKGMIKNLFKNKRNRTWDACVYKLSKNELSIQEFENRNAQKEVFYSTPFGEDKNGNPQLWILELVADIIKRLKMKRDMQRTSV